MMGTRLRVVPPCWIVDADGVDGTDDCGGRTPFLNRGAGEPKGSPPEVSRRGSPPAAGTIHNSSLRTSTTRQCQRVKRCIAHPVDQVRTEA